MDTAHGNSSGLAAIILAAGRSRRMGAFKPLLPFGETTVIESCLRNLRAAHVDDLVIVVGHRGDEIRQFLKDADVRFATNRDPDGPMAASIALGITEIKPPAPAILITPVDHPAVEAETITTIVDAWRRGAKLIQPEYHGRGGHPVLIDAGYRHELPHLDPTNGLRGFFLAHREEVLRLPVESPYVARDLDTWEDYVALHEQVFERAPRKI